MEISVALATFNGGRYLQEQLDSIRRQTLLPAQVVICDDGSTDNTVEIARRFAAEAPFAVVVDAHGQRLGFTANFVRAIGHCTRQIVALCDQDDVWFDHKLATAFAAFADAAVVAVTHRVQVVDERLKPTGLVMPPADLGGRYTVFTIDPWFSPNGMQHLFRRAQIAPWLAQPAPLSAYGFGTAPFDEWIFFLGTLSGTTILLEQTLGLWRRHDAALTRDVASIQREESAAHNLQLALHSGGESYAFRAEVTDARADFAARAVPPPVPGAAEFYHRMSQMFRRRVRLHDPKTSRGTRLRTFLTMAAHRDYRSRHRGGLGLKASLKDAFTVGFGPRTPAGS